jgi:anti-sigma factor RsiW
MTTPELDQHPDEQLEELLDGRLGADDRAVVEAHLATCARCRRLRESWLADRELLRREEVPALDAARRAAILAALPVGARGGGEGTAAAGERTAPEWGRRLALLATAAAVVAAIGLSLWFGLRPGDPVAQLVRLHQVSEPAVVTSDPSELDEYFSARLLFDPRVLDLAMMDVHLRGGGVGRVAGAPAAWMAYEGPSGRLLCVMYAGRLEALPETLDVRRRHPFVFRVYQRDGTTVVAWQEGELVCVLVGRGDPEAVVALAMAKAMLPVSPRAA